MVYITLCIITGGSSCQMIIVTHTTIYNVFFMGLGDFFKKIDPGPCMVISSSYIGQYDIKTSQEVTYVFQNEVRKVK